MSKIWKGYRPFALDGRCFRWAVHFHYRFDAMSAGFARRGSTWPPDTILLRPEDHPQALLRVTWRACTGPRLITPAFVRVCIEEALRRGWPNDHAILELPGSEVPAEPDIRSSD